MKKAKLLYLYGVAIFVIILALVPDTYITDDIRMTRSEMWAAGIGPASILCGMLLIYVVRQVNIGSASAHSLVLLWGTIYSLIIGGLIAYHYPVIWQNALVGGVIFSFLWFLGYRSWLKE